MTRHVQVLPPDNMAPIVQSPLLLALMLMWYRQAHAKRRDTPAATAATPSDIQGPHKKKVSE